MIRQKLADLKWDKCICRRTSRSPATSTEATPQSKQLPDAFSFPTVKDGDNSEGELPSLEEASQQRFLDEEDDICFRLGPVKFEVEYTEDCGDQTMVLPIDCTEILPLPDSLEAAQPIAGPREQVSARSQGDTSSADRHSSSFESKDRIQSSEGPYAEVQLTTLVDTSCSNSDTSAPPSARLMRRKCIAPML